MTEDLKKVLFINIKKEIIDLAKDQLNYLEPRVEKEEFTLRRSAVLGKANDSIRFLQTMIEQV